MSYILLTPGPTPIPPSVYKKMTEPILHHRTQEFGELFQKTLDGLRLVFRSKNEVLMQASSGTGAMESSVVNILSPGDKAVVHATGAFGDRFALILRAFGVEPVVIAEAWGDPADPAKLESALKAHPTVKAVFYQHTDTSTGVVNDLKTLSGVAHRLSDALVVVDSVSGLAAEELEADAWGLDVVVSGSQKGLMTPPGLAYLCVSERAWKACESARLPRFYFDWKTMRKSLPARETPYTPAVTLVAAQAEALRLIHEEGIENVWRRTSELAEHTRRGFKRIGLELFPKAPADNLTVGVLPGGVDGAKLIKDIRVEDRISIAGGQEQLKGKVVRISHMGFVGKAEIDAGLKALENRLARV